MLSSLGIKISKKRRALKARCGFASPAKARSADTIKVSTITRPASPKTGFFFAYATKLWVWTNAHPLFLQARFGPEINLQHT